ncbi:DUF3261 domain-containing protein [Psychromonas sp. MME2]|uniref:DUF3261 domain-containing protein n=1 Tax=unclassified Psychromonas TaxID=2614957 RepID=UPI00339C4AE3
MRLISSLLAMFILSACSMQPLQNRADPLQVEVAKNTFVTLPTPAQLQRTLDISQLISAQWGEQQQQLMVQLQVDSQQLVLAAFSAWGAPLLSVKYTEQKIETSTIPGLAANLPKPEQVLFNVMLSIWPAQAWQTPFANIGWSLMATEKQRLLMDGNGDLIMQIDYQTTPHLQGLITIKHLQLNYIINIETYNGQ